MSIRDAGQEQLIVATGLYKSFGGEPILLDVGVEVFRGRILGIIGPGGVGKSLLMKMLAGLVEPDAGDVTVLGQSLQSLNASGLARVRDRMGFLFQNYALFDFMDVGQNIAFPLEQMGVPKAEITRRVAERLAEVELPGIERLFPNELSGGMKKRVALARATIAGAPILLYDDPTAGLDPVTSSKIFELIRRLHRPDGATVIVGHDIDRMVAVCDEWLLLHEGAVLFRGTTEEGRASSHEVLKTFFMETGMLGAAA